MCAGIRSDRRKPVRLIVSPLRVALTADPELPVPPKLYGGIERVVDLLAKGLESRGHEVTLFAHPESRTAGRLVAWPGASSRSRVDTARNALCLANTTLRQRFDLIHSFSRVAYLAPLLPLAIPKLMTYQRPISPRSVAWGHRLSRGTLWFSAISRWMTRDVSHLGTWRMVSNGVPLDRYHFNDRLAAEAPLVFLGRVEEIKGPHLAIKIANRSGLPLVIAGNIPEEHRGWFLAHVAPHIDGNRVRYIGPVDDSAKNDLLRNARALLMPILWDEPFGIVMAEALACGTPVIGFNQGAVPEVVENGVTGIVADTLDELVAAIPRIPSLQRAACRARVERLFSERAVVDAYLDVYRDMLAARRARPV